MCVVDSPRLVLICPQGRRRHRDDKDEFSGAFSLGRLVQLCNGMCRSLLDKLTGWIVEYRYRFFCSTYIYIYVCFFSTIIIVVHSVIISYFRTMPMYIHVGICLSS